MSADADHWWRNRREASSSPGDAWSGGGRAFRGWMGAVPARARPEAARADEGAPAGAAARETPSARVPAQAEQTAAGRAAGRGRRPVPRVPRSGRAFGLRIAARTARSAAAALPLIPVGVPLARFGSRGRFRVGLVLGAAGLATVVFLAPLAWAGRRHPCAAAEVALVDEAVGLGSRFRESKRRVANWAGPDGKPASRGRVGRQIASEEHPGWPPFAGCTALFWRARAEGASFGGFTAVSARVLSARR